MKLRRIPQSSVDDEGLEYSMPKTPVPEDHNTSGYLYE